MLSAMKCVGCVNRYNGSVRTNFERSGTRQANRLMTRQLTRPMIHELRRPKSTRGGKTCHNKSDGVTFGFAVLVT